MQKIILIILSLNLLNASYDVGEIISVTDQNINKSTCYEGNDYQIYDNWKLADWNGALNGGHYNDIHISMYASW